MTPSNEYTDNLRRLKSLLISQSLQKRPDLKAYEAIRQFDQAPRWEPLEDLLIEEAAWKYVTIDRGYEGKYVFCHPAILHAHHITALYYRGLAGLSLKAANSYVGAVGKLESGSDRARLSPEKALKIARTYNTFISSVINGSSDWTLENGHRTIIATMGITLDGTNRNRIGDVAEGRVRGIVLEWAIENGLVVEPSLTVEEARERLPKQCALKNGIVMRFSSEPDIAFVQGTMMLAVVEIKGGIDRAGALERYGAAQKSFSDAIGSSPHCRTFYLTAIETPEVANRIARDRLVEKTYNIIGLLSDPDYRDEFLLELFHHSLRLI